MPEEVADSGLEPRVLYASVCCAKVGLDKAGQEKRCGLVYATAWHERTYETENEVVSHGLCDAHFAEAGGE